MCHTTRWRENVRVTRVCVSRVLLKFQISVKRTDKNTRWVCAARFHIAYFVNLSRILFSPHQRAWEMELSFHFYFYFFIFTSTNIFLKYIACLHWRRCSLGIRAQSSFHFHPSCMHADRFDRKPSTHCKRVYYIHLTNAWQTRETALISIPVPRGSRTYFFQYVIYFIFTRSLFFFFFFN